MTDPNTPQVTLGPLEVTCPACKGTKGFYDREADRDNGFCPCLDCHGSGFTPTPIGLQILTLVQHNARLTGHADIRFLEFP